MYYQNGNYMQDLNYYNQTPNMGYNPYMANSYSNQNMMMNHTMPGQNLNAMYPAVYRIISPVVSQVLSGTNAGYLTEDTLNNMVDTVYNIVEGDIHVENRANTVNSAMNENTNTANCERNSPNSRQNTGSTSTHGANTQNALLKDLIKIMILNEIQARRQNNPMMQCNMSNMNPTQPMFM